MSQPNVQVENKGSNISIGSDSNKMNKFGQNIVIGSGKEESRSNAGELQSRMASTVGATIISSGVLEGHEEGTTTNQTSLATVVPNGCVLLGKTAVVPTSSNGTTEPTAQDALILSGMAAVGVGAPTPDHGIPIWYNNVLYQLSAERVTP